MIATNSANIRARLSGPRLRSDLLLFLAVKGRSRGVALVLAFQDMEGFREAAGPRIANELVAQCSNKALLRMESEESSTWASKVLGQFETIEGFRSESVSGLSDNISEQRVQRDTVMASEFYNIPVTTKKNGLTGYFLSAETGATKAVIRGSELSEIVPDETVERRYAPTIHPESHQWLRQWSGEDRLRLDLKLRNDTKQEIQEPKLRLSSRNKNRGKTKPEPEMQDLLYGDLSETCLTLPTAE